MSKSVRPEPSRKNPYWIDRHRYYELTHFCLQYPIWKSRYFSLGDTVRSAATDNVSVMSSSLNTPTEDEAMRKLYYKERMELLEQTAKETDEVLAPYILLGVTEGISYDVIKVRLGIPCGKDIYYTLYRRFFWLLDKKRG